MKKIPMYDYDTKTRLIGAALEMLVDVADLSEEDLKCREEPVGYNNPERDETDIIGVTKLFMDLGLMEEDEAIYDLYPKVGDMYREELEKLQACCSSCKNEYIAYQRFLIPNVTFKNPRYQRNSRCTKDNYSLNSRKIRITGCTYFEKRPIGKLDEC